MAAICMYHQSNDNGWSPLLAAHQLIGNNRKKRHQALTCNFWLPWHSWHLASFFLPFFYFQLKPVWSQTIYCFVFSPKQLLIISDACCIFWWAFGCCALQARVEILIFHVFVLKSWKMPKSKKFTANFNKQKKFKFAPKRWLEIFLGIKHLTSVLVQTKKTLFFPKFCSKFFAFVFFSFSAQKTSTSV